MLASHLQAFLSKHGIMALEESKKESLPPAEKKELNTQTNLLVAVGASAGGLEALEDFFVHCPNNTGMSFVVIQHLSPDYKSMMSELLGRRTKMRLHIVSDGMPIEPNDIYLIPPRKNMTVFHNKLYLTDQDLSGTLNMPIDVFMRSLAIDKGGKSVGVILSGTGSDGTLGIRAIKEVGGLVMVQKPDTAQFDGMPKNAIASGLVDYCLAPSQMPEQLVKYQANPYVSNEVDQSGKPLSINEGHLPKIIGILRSHLNVDFTFYKPNTLIRRMERRMAVNQIKSFEAYASLLVRSKDEAFTLYKDLLIRVTQFFRDKAAYKVLEEEAIPKLFENPSKKSIRVWVAACSTGEEAYSIAILLQEYMTANKLEFDVKVFATDLDEESIDKAGNGFYPDSIAADVSKERLNNFFVRKNEGFQINETIRRMVVFAHHNLIKDPPFSKIDMISCRNLLIYLKPEMQQRILAMFQYAFNSKGLLFLGNSESLSEASDNFMVINSKWKIFSCVNKQRSNLLSDVLSHQHIKNIKPQTKPQRIKVERKSEHLQDIYNKLLMYYVEAGLMLDQNKSVIQIFGDVSPYLHFPKGRTSWLITDLLHEDLSLLVGNLIHRAFEEEKETVFHNFRLLRGNEASLLTIRAIYITPSRSTPAHVFLSFLTKKANEVQSKEKEIDMDAQSKKRIVDLEQELRSRDENLQTTIEELETANEELQTTNEELMTANEEMQSTNEELQSVNEELYTVNSEYQQKIEELTMLNSDVNNLLNNTNIGTLFLDRQLLIRRFTPGITRIINVLEIDIGRPISHLTFNSDYNKLYQDVQDVLQNLNTKSVEVQDMAGVWFLLRIQPYKEQDRTINGVIITLVDISDLKAAIKEAKRNELKYSQLFNNLPAGFVVLDVVENKEGEFQFFRFREVNRAFEKLTGLKAEAIAGQPTHEIMEELEVVWRTKFLHIYYQQTPDFFEAHSLKFKRYFEVYGFVPQKGQVAAIFNDVSDRKKAELQIRQQLDEIEAQNQQLEKFNQDLNAANDEYRGMNRKLAESNNQLERNRRLYHLLTEHSCDAIALCNAEQELAYISPSVINLLGYTDREVYHIGITELVHPEDQPTLKQLFERESNNLKEKLNFTYRMRHKNGNYLWIETLTKRIFSPQGVLQRVVHTHRDVTTRMKTEHELRESEARYRFLAEAASEGVVVVKENTIIEHNPQFSMMLSYDGQNLSGKHLSDFLPNYLNDQPKEDDSSYESIAIKKGDKKIDVIILSKLTTYKDMLVRLKVIRLKK